jgi:hypothetical protein
MVRGVSLAAVVLVAGSVRVSSLAKTARRTRLDLPLRTNETVGTHWLTRMGELRALLGAPQLPLVIATNTIAGAPHDAASWPCTVVRMDTEEPRGSGGALRDVAVGLDPMSHVLVAPAHSYTLEPLGSILEGLAACTADAVVHTTGEGVPTGFFRIRCGALAGLPLRGFVDLKEQALPQLASKFDVRVVRTAHAAPMAVRTLDGYVRALRVAAGVGSVPEAERSEEWRSTFALAEAGSLVHESARLHDSVVLAGGKVGAGAVVVRCLVGPEGVVGAGETVFDELIGAGGGHE